MSRSFLLLMLRGFGAGYVPTMPGTSGSCLAFLLAVPVMVWGMSTGESGGGFLLVGLSLAAAALAWYGFHRLRDEWGEYDPSEIVLDEFAGTFLVLALVTPLDQWRWFFAGFVFFRVFDMLKPFPLRIVERMDRYAGLVLDDLGAAGLAAGVTGGYWFLSTGIFL